MAVNYRGKKFYNIGPWRSKFSAEPASTSKVWKTEKKSRMWSGILTNDDQLNDILQNDDRKNDILQNDDLKNNTE